MSGTILDQVKWSPDGLVPAVVQDARDGRVLMMAWMNAESLALTLSTGFTHFFSRSRGKLWKKGESSGNVQRVEEVRLDCDGDTVLVKAVQHGPACHTESPTCFFRVADGDGTLRESDEAAGLIGVLDRVYGVIGQRRDAGDAKGSYVASLFAKGTGTIVGKVTEEAAELADAVTGEGDRRVVSEAADLLFHTLVALAGRGVTPADVAAELTRRFGTSGHAEKTARKDNPSRKKESEP